LKLLKSTFLAAAIALTVTTQAGADDRIDYDALSNQYNGKRDWTVPEAGKFGLSTFAYQDMNGNGVYELGDKPLANIPVALFDESGNLIEVKKTNVDGYANFYGSTFEGMENVTSIRKPGRYSLRLLVPDQFDLTTDTLMQTVEVMPLQGSIGGLIANNVPKISGFKRKLTLVGQTTAIDDLSVNATSRDGSKQSAKIDDRGRFELPVTKGTWTIKSKERTITVDISDTPVQLAKTFGTESKPSRNPTTTVTFDDMIRDEGVLKIPNGYAGLDWDNWVITHKHFYKGAGYKNGAVSGDYVVYNSSGHPASISRTEPFDFVGGYFSVSFDSAEGEGFDVKAYRGDQLVYHDVIELSRFGPVHFMADYRGITKLEFSTQHYWQGIADDLQFRLP